MVDVITLFVAGMFGVVTVLFVMFFVLSGNKTASLVLKPKTITSPPSELVMSVPVTHSREVLLVKLGGSNRHPES